MAIRIQLVRFLRPSRKSILGPGYITKPIQHKHLQTLFNGQVLKYSTYVGRRGHDSFIASTRDLVYHFKEVYSVLIPGALDSTQTCAHTLYLRIFCIFSIPTIVSNQSFLKFSHALTFLSAVMTATLSDAQHRGLRATALAESKWRTRPGCRRLRAADPCD
jgi:hypothetical protein